MSVVVIGGDHLGHIERKLYERGVSKLIHVSGRKKSDNRRVVLNSQTAAVLIFTDYINHNLMEEVKSQARCLDIPVIFSKRSWSAVEQKLAVGGLMNA
ncbi:dihydroorotate dehydrogenase [Anaerosporomusa subterranea]|uniref:Dihydroorotate dehydrogenase n=1 Tax=Anaerosporomusa subterranea TaxID=1794912 RepID=A0A154BVL7_ANASB|nr:DUF2325 domain-containing protein [Anaerosporomusa subterranea]KYZ77982.1 dihydroorotate dehydrogenase [Anaerosporomusa subterranea]